MRKNIFWLIILAIAEISMALYLTIWREHFWDAVAAKYFPIFVEQLIIFTIVALLLCLVSGISGYITSLLAIKWREELNTRAFAIREQRIDDNIENLNQRIQDDCLKYPDFMLTLGYGFVKAIVYILMFSISILVAFHHGYLLLLLIYSIIGTLITSFIAKPLIKLNYDQQCAEASYRNTMNLCTFKDCLIIMLGLAKKQKNLTYFQQFYGQIGVVIPLILVAPEYFNTNMLLGSLMRFNGTASTILDNTSYLINNFGNINKLLSCRKRLKEAGII